MKDVQRIKSFISEKVNFQRNRFISYTGLKVPSEIWVSSEDNLDDLTFVDDNWSITDIWCEYLLDTFDPDWERENLSFDKWYLRWYYDMLNDYIKYMNKVK